MIANMMVVAPDIEFMLYANRPVEVSLPEGNWALHLDTQRARMPYALWFQQRLPRLLAADRVSAFWGQNQMLPLRLRDPCYRLLTVHDVTAVLFPDTMTLMGRATSQLYFRKAVSAADCILADSRATARLARLCLGADARRTVVIYPGCSSEFRRVPAAQARAVASSQFGLPPVYMLTVGSIEPRKAHLSLLSAIEAVANAPVLAIVGELGWRHRPIVAAIRSHERAGRVRFLGRVADADLAAIYSAAKMMVYPSLYEGFGLPILEAMACGCPVLCRWSSSLPEAGGSAVAYFRGRGPDDLSSVIRRLAFDDAALAALAEAGMLRAREFSYRQAAEQVVGILREGVTQR